ncbi:hypothetical protein JS756_22645 [Streptomyces actuosus]|uniref:Uncharacterized protein n=1 Tax=Streptomyces actuosus TaxID=1885 RepID=A0ABS2VUX2_STRAS|nr:hypothetical protein [Streptomyces actuosus]MBN0046859.1 hypothetical protein [Streptomyces actuosus]
MATADGDCSGGRVATPRPARRSGGPSPACTRTGTPVLRGGPAPHAPARPRRPRGRLVHLPYGSKARQTRDALAEQTVGLPASLSPTRLTSRAWFEEISPGEWPTPRSCPHRPGRTG